MDPTEFDEPPEVVAEVDELEPDHPDYEFAMLEKEYNRVVSEMEEDPKLQHYLEEYVKLFDQMYATREKALQMASEKERLETALNEKLDKLMDTEQKMQEDSDLMTSLTSEIEKTHILIDQAHGREQCSQEMIDNLRKQIASLEGEIEFKNKLNAGDLEEDPLESKSRQGLPGLQREKNKLANEVARLKEKLNSALVYQEELERQTSTTDMKICEINNLLEETTAELNEQLRNKVKLESKLTATTSDHDDAVFTINELTSTIQANQKLIASYESRVRAQLDTTLKCHKTIETNQKYYLRLKQEFDRMKNTALGLAKDNDATKRNMNFKMEQNRELAQQISKINEQRELAERRGANIDTQRIEIANERDYFRHQVKALENHMNDIKKEAEAVNRDNIVRAQRENILRKAVQCSQAVSSRQENAIQLQQTVTARLHTDLEACMVKDHKQRKQIVYLQRERLRLQDEAEDRNDKLTAILEELRLLKLEILNYNKQKQFQKKRERIQESSIEDARTETKHFRDQLTKAQEINANMGDKLQDMQLQSEQLVACDNSKSAELVQKGALLGKVTQEKDTMKLELATAKDTVTKLRQVIGEMRGKERHMHDIITAHDRKIKNHLKTITELMSERDVLGAQLVRRNNELSLLYDKVNILQTLLARGGHQYEQRLEDIRLLKLEIKRVRQEKALLTTSIQNMNDLQVEIFHLERDLTKERVKTKILEHEIHNPTNIHRWRKLEGSDPHTFELLAKIKILQDRALRQSKVMTRKELQMKEMERLFVTLRSTMEKLPSPDIGQRIITLQRKLAVTVKRNKCIISELRMFELDNARNQSVLTKQAKEVGRLRQELLKEKKMRRKTYERIRALQEAAPPGLLPPATTTNHASIKFVGGGFKMSVTNQSK